MRNYNQILKELKINLALIIILLSTIIIINPNPLAFGQIPCVSEDPNDTDGDGISNIDEQNGVDINNDYVIDLDLPSLDANPLHKDLFIEIDYMTHHKPRDLAIQHVVEAFANAPVCNPFVVNGNTIDGINLHILVDNSTIIPEQNYTSYRPSAVYLDLNDIKKSFFGTAMERDNINWPFIHEAKEKYFHYGIFVHTQEPNPFDQDNIKYSGIADLPGMNFIVSLGYKSWGLSDELNHNVGSVAQQEGTLMHEFGHNLDLHHGGGDDFNYKPNYISVMNYIFQLGSRVERQLDYSTCSLISLNENNLNESHGMGSNCYEERLTVIKCPDRGITVAVGGSKNWDFNNDNDSNEVGLAYDINGKIGGNCVNSKQILTSHDDWQNIQYISNNVNFGDIPFELAGNLQTGSSIFTDIENGSSPITNEIREPELSSDDMKEQLKDVVMEIGKAIDKLNYNSVSLDNIDPTGSIANNTEEREGVIAKDFLKMELGLPNNNTFNTLANIDTISPADSVITQIENGNLTGARQELEEFKSYLDSSQGGDVAYEIVTNPTSQIEILSLIEYAQERIKSQE